MTWLFYLRLIGCTAGTLVYLFLLALILGHRRPRRFERLLFSLLLSLFLIYAGGLLDLNSRLHYESQPKATLLLYSGLIAVGGLFLLPLVVQAHLEYLRHIRNESLSRWAAVVSRTLYLVPAGLLWAALLVAHTHPTVGFGGFLAALVRPSGLIVLVSAIIAATLQWVIAQSAQDPTERRLFQWLFGASLLLVLSVGLAMGIPAVTGTSQVPVSILIAGILPGAVLIRYSLRRNFLEFGSQRNLVYALSATFLALLYLALVRRVSVWLEPTLPPEATASILLFVLLFLFEPLERAIGPALHRRMSEQMARVQRLTVELQQEARQGDVSQLIASAEQRIGVEFGLAAVRISVLREASGKLLESPGGLGHTVQIALNQDGGRLGSLEAASTGSYLTGETSAALEFIGEQLPAIIDLCRLIEEKVRLERELAERERLAVLGQMAASVSHNLRNPLSSMKTILQVQLEHPNLPLDVRHDCALVVTEIDRMGEKLKQLLSFAKPSVNGHSVAAVELARQTAALFARDAERRKLRLEFDGPTEEVFVLASEDAIGEVLSNLIVNAIEAQPCGGRVRVGLVRVLDRLEMRVDDDGPGISADLRAKIFQPYFTTKATGTGLGLSIVARRADEVGGTISCESPVKDGKGTRFRFSLPLAGEKGRG